MGLRPNSECLTAVLELGTGPGVDPLVAGSWGKGSQVRVQDI